MIIEYFTGALIQFLNYEPFLYFLGLLFLLGLATLFYKFLNMR